jgi:hypothetical protein
VQTTPLSVQAVRGNIYRLHRDAYLEYFEVYLATALDCYVDFYVHERSGPLDDWEVVWFVHHWKWYDGGWSHSSAVDTWMESGKEYAILRQR